MLVSMKTSDLIDKLVVIADGDFELVQEAVAACAQGADGAALKDVVAYIETHRRAPTPAQSAAAA
ncbi:MAG: hypothetical protein ACTHLO_15090 [Pseudolabrys sp.]